jgi:hypothetical protein
MFPEEFADEQIVRYSSPGDVVCDIFSGRGTTLLQGLLRKRHALAVDINPVAYCVSAAKAHVPQLSEVKRHITLLEQRYQCSDAGYYESEREALPAFFRRAFYHTTLRELLFLRSALNWKDSSVHGFIAALVLGSLHGEMDKSRSYFSNQMPRTISTKPDYSVEFWNRNNLWPKKKSVFEILRSRGAFRLREEDVPELHGEVVLGDARRAGELLSDFRGRVKLLCTSPPYLNVTSYEEDQWLRLWFLGSEPNPTYRMISQDDRHMSATKYWAFLKDVWEGVEPLLAKGATLVCRIGGKNMKREEMIDGLSSCLRDVFPRLRRKKPPEVSRIRNRQTDYFRPGSKGCLYEIDFAFTLC